MVSLTRDQIQGTVIHVIMAVTPFLCLKIDVGDIREDAADDEVLLYITDKPFNYNSCGDTVSLHGCFKSGKAVLVNLAPSKEGFTLILAEVDMVQSGTMDSAYANEVRGWMKHAYLTLPEFLKEYSLCGGTHHSALVYDADVSALEAFGEYMGFDVEII